MNMNQKLLSIFLVTGLTVGTITFSTPVFAQQPTTKPAPSTPAATTTALDLIAGYQSIASSLEAARTSVSSDPPGALARVQSAQNLFRRLEPQIGSQKLVDAGTNALKRAVSTVNQRSAVNLGAQSMLVKSILQRVMYDRLFSELGNGRIPGAVRYANTLASAFNMPNDSLNTLKAAVKRNDVGKARSILESQVADIMTNSLKIARDNIADKTTAYQAVVRASSHFLIVQDSPRVGEELTVSSFASAVQSITSGDVPGFKQGIASLLTRTQDFGKRARGIALSASNPSTATPTPTVAASNPSNPTNPSNPSNPSTPTIKPPTTTPSITPVNQTPVMVLPNAVDTISGELSKAGIPAAQAKTLATSLANQKISSFSGVLDQLSVTLSDALIQIQNGDVQEGRRNLEVAKNLFDSAVKPALEVVGADQAAQTSRVFDATVSAVGVRPVDVTVLLGEVFSIKNFFKNAQPASMMQNLSASVQPWWAGFLRGILFFITSLLFIYPIYLLNLAFGGKNPYWRYIGIAMVLLFIPPLIEGLAWLGSFIAQNTGITFFDSLSSLSVLQNPLAQIAWVILLIAAAAFATAGFRGIATQFGLIRNRNNGSQSTMNTASVAPAMLGASGGAAAMSNNNSSPINNMDTPDPRISSDVSVNPDRTIVEWDEEF
jgi:hypothetical protein